MQYNEMDLTVQASTIIGLRKHFSTNALKKHNIVNVHSVWQHIHANDEDGVQAKPPSPLHEEMH